VSLLKTLKSPISVAFLAPQSYRHRHAYASVRPGFPALVPGSQPRLAGTRGGRPATPGDRPALATPWPASALLLSMLRIRSGMELQAMGWPPVLIAGLHGADRTRAVQGAMPSTGMPDAGQRMPKRSPQARTERTWGGAFGTRVFALARGLAQRVPRECWISGAFPPPFPRERNFSAALHSREKARNCAPQG
jgi:hypothetical protein